MVNLAAMTFAARNARKSGSIANPVEAAMARKGYRAEPLSSTALSLIITTLGAGEARNEILKLSGKISRRNGILNEELIKLAADQGDDAAFFQWLSRSVLTNDELRAGYVGAMAEATAREGAVEALAPVVGSNPRWADYYWRQILRHPASFLNAARLRLAIAAAPWRRTELTETDQLLVWRLVGRSQFEAAYKLVAGLGGASKKNRDILANNEFARQPRLAPFDWQLAVSGTLGSTIDEKQKVLTVSAIGGARGYAARQLVRLSPGTYRLGWDLSSSVPLPPSSLSARLYCAERGVKSVTPPLIPLRVGRAGVRVSILDGACHWHWLSVDIALPDGSSGLDANFRRISLLPDTGGVVDRSTSTANLSGITAPN